MAIYALAVSPFGNFAVVKTASGNLPSAVESYRLIPMGELTEIPLTKDGYLDNAVREVEALRQLEARGSGKHPFLTPLPEYTINRATYNAELYVDIVKHYNDGSLITRVDTSTYSHGLTDSARNKLTAWWDSISAEVITPQFLASTELDSAEYAYKSAARRMNEAEIALNEAEAGVDTAASRLAEARAALEAL